MIDANYFKKQVHKNEYVYNKIRKIKHQQQPKN